MHEQKLVRGIGNIALSCYLFKYCCAGSTMDPHSSIIKIVVA